MREREREMVSLFYFDEDHTIVLYNIGSQEIKNLQDSGLPNVFCHAKLYVESLVSLEGGNVF